MNAHQILTPDTRENVEYADGYIRMDAPRSRRLWRELCKLDDAIKTLATSAQTFPQADTQRGEINPEILVTALTDKMQAIADHIFAMLNCEEPIHEELGEAADE